MSVWNGISDLWPSIQQRERCAEKKIKLNHISKIGERRIYAKDLINRLSEQLRRGWNPWIEWESALSYVFIDDAIEHFFRIQKKYLDDDIIREATYVESQEIQ